MRPNSTAGGNQQNSLYLGVDIGSATVKVIGIDRQGDMVGPGVYLRHDQFASPTEALMHAMRRYLGSVPGQVAGIGITGSGRAVNARLIGADLVRTEIFAHAMGLAHLVATGKTGLTTADTHPKGGSIGTLIEIGGQDSKIIVFGPDGLPAFFNMNTICSAGTGEFLKQIADEAGISLEEFGRLALKSDRPASIDSTCTVFSRRDFRHLTQKGVPLADRLMGVCQAMVRNYLTNVVQGVRLPSPVFFQGGVAFNPAVVRAFEQRLQTPVYVTPHNDVVGALGMAVIVRETMSGQGELSTRFRDDFDQRSFHSRVQYCHGCLNSCDLAQPYELVGDRVIVLETLGGRCEGAQNPKNVKDTPPPGRARFQIPVRRRTAKSRPFNVVNPAGKHQRSSTNSYFAGLDGGSRGTKYALIRSLGSGSELEIVATGTVDTAGDAIAACVKALRGLQAALPAGATLAAIGTTGSAGELFRDMVTRKSSGTADLRSSEIVAHYAWAQHWMPEVGTVMDIGGNDAKLITVAGGGLDFAMNDKCAAGTGSFLEAVARRFRVPIEEYADVAMKGGDAVRIAGRCAVFGESDIVHKARSGFPTEDLFLGLAFAICRTYLSDVGRGKTLYLPVVGQGGAFLNRALQYAFRETLGLTEQEFVVSDNPTYVLCAGALGAALMAMGSWEQGQESHFKGFDYILSSSFATVTTRCALASCHRQCDEVVALLENQIPIAGYKAIDCHQGRFCGLMGREEEREHVRQLLAVTGR
jgi:predicted CoA-substrate-specific enzyme activase